MNEQPKKKTTSKKLRRRRYAQVRKPNRAKRPPAWDVRGAMNRSRPAGFCPGLPDRRVALNAIQAAKGGF